MRAATRGLNECDSVPVESRAVGLMSDIVVENSMFCVVRYVTRCDESHLSVVVSLVPLGWFLPLEASGMPSRDESGDILLSSSVGEGMMVWNEVMSL